MKLVQVEGFPVVVDFTDANIVDVDISDGDMTLDIFSSSQKGYSKMKQCKL